MSVKSVYNFVPAPKENEVFKPDWAKQVSHDIPFSDGERGEIEFEIEAKTPIYIRNGHSKQDAEEENERYLSFSYVKRNGKKEFFIPGSSLKGAVRNVFEIITKSRLNFIAKTRPAVRQIMRPNGTVVDEGYTLKDLKKEIRGGWLIEKDGDYYIYDCGHPFKIRYTELDKKFNQGFSRAFQKNGTAKISSNFSNRSAKYKYEKIIGGKTLEYELEYHPLDENDKQKSWVSNFQPLKYVRFPKDNTSTFWGTIVCTGQSMEYNNTQARKGEYVFKGRKEDIIKYKKRKINLSEEKFQDFLFVNRHNQREELEDWKYFKKKIKSSIPVFFRYNRETKEVIDFGLTFMYKQPAKYSTHELYPYSTYMDVSDKNYKPDLADIIFGLAEKDDKLKGRVIFSHSFTINEVNELPDQSLVLSSPRSTYFPFYLKQRGRNGKVSSYLTYNVKGSSISGFKRYPVRNNPAQINIEGLNEKMITTIRPLDTGIRFQGKVRFHNLRKIEIGALFSALTFHNNNANHSLGYAKPFGYGKIKISVIKTSSNLNYSLEDYLKEFELTMKKHSKTWDIFPLISMAIEGSNDQNLTYPDINEFQEYKKRGDFLEPYSNPVRVNYLVTQEELEKEKELERKKQLEEEKGREEEEIKKAKVLLDKYNNHINAANQFFNEKVWDKALNELSKAIELRPNEQYPNKQKKLCKQFIEGENLNLEPITSLNDFNKGKKIIEEYYKKATGHTVISDNEQVQILKGFINRCIEKSDKRWKKSGKQDWVLVKKWVGQEKAHRWFDELKK